MNSRISFLGPLLFLVLTASLFSQEEFDPKEGAHLTGKERVYSDGEIQSLPVFSFSTDIRKRIEEHDTKYLTEITWVMPPLPENYQNLEKLAALFLNVEALEGLEYWSGGRDRMAPYIKKSYRVDVNGSRTALPPLRWPEQDKSVSFVQFQRDTSFGSNWYDVTVQKGVDSVLMETLNLTDLKAFTKKTQDAGGVLMQLAVIPEKNRTIMYSAVAFKEFPPIGWGRSAVSGSFNHRVSAIQSWFANTIFGPEEQ